MTLEIDDQNYDVDINKIYQNFIVEIDKIRSHVSVQDNPSLQKITTLNTTTNTININVDKNVQESRCHAFYRLLGLPVTDGETLYSPGLDIPNNGNQTITGNKTTIAQKLFQNVPGIENLLNAREQIQRNFLSLFSLQDVDAMVLAMSLQDIRPLTISLSKINGIFDKELNNQTYASKLTERLIPVVQNNGNFSTNVKVRRQHILIPFIVDPRIDLSVTPKRNRLAVPFLQDKSQTKLTDNVYLKRPYIEKVCRDRFDTSPKVTTLGTHTQEIIDNIKNNPFIKGNQLIQQAYNPNVAITSETVQFTNYFNAIRSVLNKLYESVRKVTPVLAADPNSNGEASFNWTPIPNTSGPEKGSSTRDLLSGQASDPSNTAKDLDIINLLYSQALANISNKLTTLQTVDLGGFAFDGTELTPDQNSSDSMGDLTQPQITMYQNQRTNETSAANDAIRTIEIIMGEFSGLGLLDILVISAAFWVVDKKDLLGMLDDIAIKRMLLNPNLQASEVTDRLNNGSNIGNSLLNFQNKVKEIFDICDSLYEQIKSENKK